MGSFSITSCTLVKESFVQISDAKLLARRTIMLGLQDKSYVLAEENTAHHTLTDQKSETPEVTVKSILSKRVDDEVTHLADRIQDTFNAGGGGKSMQEEACVSACWKMNPQLSAFTSCNFNCSQIINAYVLCTKTYQIFCAHAMHSCVRKSTLIYFLTPIGCSA